MTANNAIPFNFFLYISSYMFCLGGLLFDARTTTTKKKYKLTFFAGQRQQKNPKGVKYVMFPEPYLDCFITMYMTTTTCVYSSAQSACKKCGSKPQPLYCVSR